MKSIERCNKVLGVHINAIKGKDQLTKADGPNPFANLGMEMMRKRHLTTSISEQGRNRGIPQNFGS
jgi:hypothetical protein